MYSVMPVTCKYSIRQGTEKDKNKRVGQDGSRQLICRDR